MNEKTSSERVRRPSAVASARIEEATRDLACREQTALRERIERAEAIHQESHAKLVQIFGPERYGAWRRFTDQRRDARRNRALPPYDVEQLQAGLEQRVEADHAEARALLNDWQISAEEVRAVAAEAGRRITGVIAPVEASPDEGLVFHEVGFTLASHDDGLITSTVQTPPYGGTAGIQQSSQRWSV